MVIIRPVMVVNPPRGIMIDRPRIGSGPVIGPAGANMDTYPGIMPGPAISGGTAAAAIGQNI